MGKAARAVVVGDLVLDLVAITPDQIHHGADTLGAIYPRPGGSAANTATWMARLGLPVLFAGRVGADPLGRALVQRLQQEGVEARVAEDPVAPTGTIIAMINPAGERSMLISPGANHQLAPTDVPAEALAGAGVLHLTGYSFFWDAPRTAATAAMAAARELGIPIAVDASSASLLRQHGVQRFLTDIQGATYLFCNESEAQVLTGQTDPQAALDTLAGSFPVVGLKLGPAGCRCAAGEQRIAVPARRVTAVDSTGCGDAWDAGFLTGMLRGLSLLTAARLGIWTATWVLTRPGAVPVGWREEDLTAAWGYAIGREPETQSRANSQSGPG